MLSGSDSIITSIADLTSFLNNTLLTQSTAIQLAIILICLSIGYVTRKLLPKTISGLIKEETDKSFSKNITKYKNQLSEFKVILWPLISGALLWIIQATAANLKIPGIAFTTETIRLASILLLAWAAIRFASIFISSPRLSRLFEFFAWSTAALAALGWLSPFISALDSVGIPTGETTLSIWRVMKMIIFLSLFFWLANKAVHYLQNQINITTSIAPSLRVLFSKISSFVLYGAAILFALNTVGIDLTAFAVFTGALGVGLGFGLQKIISNFISGIILLLDKSLKPGDVIEVETGNGITYGWVEKLGLRYTSITTRDGTETLIPNETFITNPVTNWSFSNERVRRKMPIGVAYDTDVEKAMELCQQAASATKRVLENPAPVCQLRGFEDSYVNLEVRFWIGDPAGGVKNVESAVNLAIWKLFKEHNIEIPYPQRDIHLRSLNGLPLALKTQSQSES